MESNENSFEASSKVSMGQDQSKLYSIDFESSENLNFYQNKDFSIRKNSLSLEKDLNLLSQKVTDLKHKNKKLKSNLNLALREKEINIENHAKEISKILKENKRLREQLEAESRKHKKESQGLREEFDKIKKEYKKFCISSETKIKNLQSELQQQREINLNQAQRNERENNELVAKIKLIETSANQFKSPGNSPTKFTTGFLEPNFYSNIKKRASYVEIPRLKMYSIEELSIVIVKLEKLQADLKEKLSGAPNNNQEILKSEIKANENKLAEAKNLQKKLIMAGKIKNFEVL